MSNKTVQIYALSSSSDKENIRYIGKTIVKLNRRLSQHVVESKRAKTYKQKWIKKEIERGNRIIITPLFSVPIVDDWEKWEIHFIDKHKKLGYKLTNSTTGGEGQCGEGSSFFGKKHTKRARVKMSLAQKNKKTVNQYSVKGNLIATHSSICKAAEQSKLSFHAISAACHKRYGRKTVGGYVWRFAGDAFSLNYLNSAEPLKKKVCQYDKGGHLIATYASLSEAATKNNAYCSVISKCCNGSIKTCYGYIWRFKEDKFSYNAPRSGSKPIYQCDLNGNVIKKFYCIKEAVMATGCNKAHIFQCCNNKPYYKTAGGFKWKYAQ